jgi:hypothetical protein
MQFIQKNVIVVRLETDKLGQGYGQQNKFYYQLRHEK